jgi:hypothetical protein
VLVGLVLLPLPIQPTAQALPSDTAATPRKAQDVPGSGLGTRVQVVPFHRRISVLPVPQALQPTAQALPSDVAATRPRPPLMVNPAAVGSADLV